LSGGDLKSRFYSESKDELGQLANVFNRIADQLEESNSENEKTKRAVDIKIDVETKSLKETITALEKKIENRTIETQKMNMDSEKFKENLKIKEAELSQLRNQIAELKKRLDKNTVKDIKVQK
jgi:methyl-accepting chemotaxis protein